MYMMCHLSGFRRFFFSSKKCLKKIQRDDLMGLRWGLDFNVRIISPQFFSHFFPRKRFCLFLLIIIMFSIIYRTSCLMYLYWYTFSGHANIDNLCSLKSITVWYAKMISYPCVPCTRHSTLNLYGTRYLSHFPEH